MNINKSVIEQYVLQYYGKTLSEKVEELIHQENYLGKDKKIPNNKLSISIYHISEQLNEIVSIAPTDIDDNKVYDMIQLCVSNNIKTYWHIAPPVKEKKIKYEYDDWTDYGD